MMKMNLQLFAHKKGDVYKRQVFSNPDIESYEIVCYDAEDYALLKEFLVPVK